ncbi:hypothetical protein [Vibrio sp. THAF190c]|uniref:hypothetical protein n=1 Tax=Vibrio sp. THAF190c TaxID=2587865 RepID=UPI00126886F3|nr:hypothetical protein [Vibrio sp. THAF190c]
MSNYGIVELSNRPGSFRARVPMLKKGTYTSKDFSNEKYLHPMTSAQAWRDELGKSTWGEEIWMYIKKTKSVRCLWGKKGGVSVCHKTIEGEGEIWIVMWREKGKPKIMPFLLKDDIEAKKNAEEYAKKKKVELSFLNRI